ncbi:MAG TPA: MerC domain-containing protein [Bacteriovoracaceae bacterium]|nr:MerC domain-containing protein [Bacteriovoracaceae bacterium]
MNDIKLVYFEGCPEAKNIRAALLNAGVFDFQVIIQGELPDESPYRRLSSPSVLKNEEIIYGIRTDGQISTCTFDRIDSRDGIALIERFKELKDVKKSVSKSSFSFMGSLFSMLLVVKCPACIPALVAFLSTLGLSFLISQVMLKSILILMLLISMGGLAYSYKRHKNFIPLFFGGIFSVALYVGRFYFFGDLNQLIIYTAITGLIITTLWDFKLKSKRHCPSCV